MTWSEDNLDDAELDDEIEAFERSLKTDWEVRLKQSVPGMRTQSVRAIVLQV